MVPVAHNVIVTAQPVANLLTTARYAMMSTRTSLQLVPNARKDTCEATMAPVS
jgi:hypothetical protein